MSSPKETKVMKLPKEFMLKGKRWKLIYKWGLSARTGNDGLCVFSDRSIILDRSLTGEYKIDVFLHELTHALLFEAHINPGTGVTPEVEEIICDAVSDAFMSIFDLKFKRKRNVEKPT